MLPFLSLLTPGTGGTAEAGEVVIPTIVMSPVEDRPAEEEEEVVGEEEKSEDSQSIGEELEGLRLGGDGK